MIIATANPEILSELGPAEFLYRQGGAAAQSRAADAGSVVSMSATSICRAWRMPCFLRSPHAHAKILSIDAGAARRLPGVIAIVTGKELSSVITPWVGVLSHLKGLKSAPQHAIAIDRVCWQGEAVAAIVATSRAVARGCGGKRLG